MTNSLSDGPSQYQLLIQSPNTRLMQFNYFTGSTFYDLGTMNAARLRILPSTSQGVNPVDRFLQINFISLCCCLRLKINLQHAGLLIKEIACLMSILNLSQPRSCLLNYGTMQ